MPNSQMEQSDKAVFAAYLNLARHNIFIIVNHIQQKLGLKLVEDDALIDQAKLWNYLHKNNKNVPEENTAALKLLARHFTFINENQDPAILKAFFLSALKRLNEERNDFTHAYHEKDTRTAITDIEGKNGPINSLVDYLVNAKNFLDRKINDGFERQELAKARGEELPQLFKGFGENELKTLKELEINLYHADSNKFTQEGLAFFAALFLDKPHAARFIDRVPIFKHHPHQLLIKEWLWTYACRIPQPKLESGEVSMDILNELHRAPKPLYNFLSVADKASFEVNFHEEDESLMEALGNQKSILKRAEDRFPYFAMRVMDEVKLFDKLRFQVHLGKWLRKSYQSENIEERKIYENLRTFGRLDFYKEENAPDDWKKEDANELPTEEKTPDNWCIPAIEQFAPHYLVTGNRIGIKINRQNHDGEWYPLPAYQPLAKENKAGQIKKAEKFQPDAILSTYDLGNLFFYQYLHKQGKITLSSEDFINRHIQQLYRFCEAVKAKKVLPITTEKFTKKIRRPYEAISDDNHYNEEEWQDLDDRKNALQKILDNNYPGLLIRHLPSRIKEYLLAYDLEDSKGILLKLNQRKQETIQLKRNLHRAIDKIIQRERVVPQEYTNPVLAKFLVEDIMEWRPKDRKMQQSAKKDAEQLERLLNNFPHQKTDLEEHIKSMRLIDRKYAFAHPFLHKVNPSKRMDSRELYWRYLKEKAIWLNQLQQAAGKKEDKPTQYFRKRLNNPQKKVRIANTLEETQSLLAEMENQYQVEHSEILKNGDLATYLVQDIVFFKPINKTADAKNFGKPNNQEYKRLHSMLALYSTDVASMVAFMAQLGILGNPKDNPYVHPFLNKTNPAERAGIKEFYEYYLIAKIEWLEKLEKEVAHKKLVNYERYFEKLRKNNTIKTYSNIPVLLPRGLFNDSIRQALSEDSNLDIQETDHFVTCLKKYLNKDSQDFYTWHRTYSIEGVDQIVWQDNVEDWDQRVDSIVEMIQEYEAEQLDLADKKKRFPETSFVQLRKLKKLKRKAMSNEQLIRLYQHTDRVLLVMLQLLTNQKKPQDAFYLDFSKIQLAAIQPENRNRKALDQKLASQGNLLDEPIVMEMDINGKRVVDLLSIKRHGAFRRFFKDRRVNNLVKYFSPANAQKTTLENLLSYWEGLSPQETTSILAYLKMNLTEEELLLKIEADGNSAVWNIFNRDWRILITHYFDASIFEIGQLKLLLQQLDEHTILRRQLIKELEDYDTNRYLIYERILAFEQKVYDIAPAIFQQKLATRPEGKQHLLPHRNILAIVQSKITKEKLSDRVLNELCNFRNAIAHNEIYYSDYLNNKIASGNGKIVATLFNRIIKTYDALISKMTALEVSNETSPTLP